MHRLAVVFASLCLGFAGCGGGTSEGEFEYVALGASDATGVGASPIDNGYVFRIKDGLERSGYDVGLLNLGIPGVETDEVQNLELPLAIEEEPEVVTVFTGPNDIVAGISEADFTNDISEILQTLATDTQARVYIATIPDLTQLPRYQENPEQNVSVTRIQSFNAIIRSEAAKSGATLIELSDDPILDGEVSDDGFHPNDDGHRRIAEAFLSAISRDFPGQPD